MWRGLTYFCVPHDVAHTKETCQYVGCESHRAYECVMSQQIANTDDTSNRHTATHCNTLQHTATHCNTLQHTARHCDTLQHTATHCTRLHQTAPDWTTLPHCNTLQHKATHCTTLQHTAPHCNTLQHTATHCNTLRHTHLTHQVEKEEGHQLTTRIFVS